MSDSLGTQLRKARLKRGYSLEEVESATNIRAARLADLEKGSYKYFPSKAYVRGFLITYSKFLDVDISRYLKEGDIAADPSFNAGDYQYLQGKPVTKYRIARHVEKMTWRKLLPCFVLVTFGLISFFIWYSVVSFQRLGSLERLAKIQNGGLPPQTPQAVPVHNNRKLPTTEAELVEREADQEFVSRLNETPSSSVRLTNWSIINEHALDDIGSTPEPGTLALQKSPPFTFGFTAEEASDEQVQKKEDFLAAIALPAEPVTPPPPATDVSTRSTVPIRQN